MKVDNEYIVRILRLNNEGYGIAKIDNFIIFIKNALINELVKCKITKLNKSYGYADILEILDKSDDRVDPVCPYYYECGGCNLMHMDYKSQLNFKKEKVKSIFKKICNIDIELDDVKSFNNLYYRNKVVFKVRGDKVGFYKSKTNEIVDIDNCLISNKKINECLKVIRSFVCENKCNDISDLMIRICNNEVMVAVDNINKKVENDFISILKNNKISSIYINHKLVYGKKNINQTINDLTFEVSEKSFFQVNIKTATMLYNEALKNVNKQNISVDLYSGTGTISLLLAKKSKKVIGIEVVKDAVVNAQKNMKLNNINNVEFKCGKVKDLIENIKKLDVDVLVMDPPRSGSDKKTLEDVLKIKPKQLIYISCNPVTLARDYNILRDKYEINEIFLFDMFPNTYHIECLCLLNIKQ